MNALPELSESALVLVAVLPSQRDLDIARLLGWYRIPLKTAPKIIAVDYLAFYLTGAFPAEQRHQVAYIAPLKGFELTTRAELFREEGTHPRAREEYFKLQLGSLIALPQPIPAGSWKRVSFFYTTIKHVKRAEKLSELPVHDEERSLLWAALRERSLRSEEYQAEELPLSLDDPLVLALLSGLTGLK